MKPRAHLLIPLCLIIACLIAEAAWAQIRRKPSDASSYEEIIGKKFADCIGCPEMMVVPGGWFVAYPREVDGVFKGDRYPVLINHAFAVGVYDVTRSQYAQFVRETERLGGPGCQFLDGNSWRADSRLTWDHPGFAQTDNDPVVCVSYLDATDYIAWLNSKLTPESMAKLGKYRIPTGAEWEFVARRGASRAYDYFGAGAIKLD